MTRRKGILKILFVALAVLLLAVFFAGCGEYTPPQNQGGGSSQPPTVITPPIGSEDPPTDGFTVTLTHYDGAPFTSADYPLITRLQAQWTEITDGRPSVYRASFNGDGVADVGELDGDFNVTLVLNDEFRKLYTYDPNPAREERKDELKATNLKKDVSIPLYRLTVIDAADGRMNIGGVNTPYNSLTQTGAYSYTLQSRTDKRMFFYKPSIKGEYSFMTLMDVTADEVNPIVDLHFGQPGFYVNPIPALTQDGGGAEGNYTKNVWLKYQISADEVGNGLIFNLYSESERADAYPLTIYFIFERDGEFSRPVETSTPVPVTENFGNKPATPDGEFAFIGARNPVTDTANTQHILYQENVKYYDPAVGGDGYYYYKNPATGDFFKDENGNVSAQYRVYAVLGNRNQVHDAFNNPDLAKMLAYVCEMVGEPAYNYSSFVTRYISNCNGDGAYPVNEELKTFLQRWAVSQRYFNDGNGYAESTTGGGPGYNSDEDSQWLYACGVYIKR